MNDDTLVGELRAAAGRAEGRRTGTRPTVPSLGPGFQERATARILAEVSARRPAPVTRHRAAFTASSALVALGALGAAAAIALAVHSSASGSRRGHSGDARDTSETRGGQGGGAVGDAVEGDGGVPSASPARSGTRADRPTP